MEITKREILFSFIIMAIMVFLGMVISRPILSHSLSNALKTISSVQSKDSVTFNYIKRTDVGDFLAEGIINTINPVSIDDIEGKYQKIKKEKQEYRRHTETYTTTDSKGDVQTHTRTYWSWDTIHTDVWKSDSLLFYGNVFTYKDIRYNPAMTYLKTIKPKRGFFETEIRYKYYTAPMTEHGTLSGNISDKSFINLRFIKNQNIDSIIKESEETINVGPIIFWIFWLFLTGILIIVFCNAENRWLY